MTAHNVETERSRAVIDRPYSFAGPRCSARSQYLNDVVLIEPLVDHMLHGVNSDSIFLLIDKLSDCG